jgi:8-oxo-dGTP pyrophosphatase MutT (NUDIX family)
MIYTRGGQPHLLLTRRRDDLQSHAGQVSFPGGRNEASETLLATAIRETFEEVGVKADSLTILGKLTPLYISPSDFEVHPYVACHSNGQAPVFTPNPNEVSQIIEAPLSQLMDPATIKKEMWTIRGYELLVPFFAVQEHKVWGATAMMISELLARLRITTAAS